MLDENTRHLTDDHAHHVLSEHEHHDMGGMHSMTVSI